MEDQARVCIRVEQMAVGMFFDAFSMSRNPDL